MRNKLLGQVDRHTGRKYGSKCGRSCTDWKKTSTELHAHTAWEEVADKKDWDNLGLTWRRSRGSKERELDKKRVGVCLP